jgi:hypothetical protein
MLFRMHSIWLRSGLGNEEEFLDIGKTFNRLSNVIDILHNGRNVYFDVTAEIYVVK